MNMKWVTCQQCGETFQAAKRSRCFCDDCKRKRQIQANMLYMRNKRAGKVRQITTGNCQLCGATITKKTPLKKYCDDCARKQKLLHCQEANRRRSEERKAEKAKEKAKATPKEKPAPPPPPPPKPKIKARVCIWCNKPLRPGCDRRTVMHPECRNEYTQRALHQQAEERKKPKYVPPKLSVNDICKIMAVVEEKHGVVLQYGSISKYTDDEKLELLNGKRPWK